MSDPLDHYEYLADQVKLDRYRTAIEQLVRADQMVLDLGCGTGILGLMALQAGARKVIFVDGGPVIEIARRTILDAGFGDKAEFHQNKSFELTLKDPIDIAICDHIGYFGFDYGVIDLLADARQRFLKPDGVVVPAEIQLQLAPIESEVSRQEVQRWCDGSAPEEYAWVRTSAANTKHSVQLTSDDLLDDSVTLETLVLGESAPEFLTWNSEFKCNRNGTFDGLAGWFDCRLVDDVRMTNSPVADKRLNRPQAFLPLEQPVDMKAGQSIHVNLMIRPRDNVIGWIVELPDTNQRFEQNTFNGLQLATDTLARIQPDRVAALNDRGRARQIILALCDGNRTVADVQEIVQRDHPHLFPTAETTRSFVSSVLSLDAHK